MAFGYINWIVVVAFIAGTTVLGHRLKGKEGGLQQFFLGGKGLPWWAVSCSIMASQISAVTIIAVPGAIFRTGGSLLFLQGTLIGFVIAKFLMVALFIGPFYEHKVFSPYDFIENRLGARASNLSRGLFIISAILGHGIRLLTVALVLSVVVGIPIGQSILLIGVFAILWTLMGGITTVIWTDFIMFIVMVGGAILSLVLIFRDIPVGISGMLTQLDEAAKLRLIDVSADPQKTWTIWTSIVCFTIFELAQNSVDQVITQRMMCCRNQKDAKKAVLGSLGIIGITLLMTAVGLGVWLFYQHNPITAEHASFLAEQPSRAYPFFVVKELPPGVSGLIIAAIFAAGISTLDSALAALSETTVNGFYLKFFKPGASEAESLRVSRISVIVWGIVLSGLAYVAGKLVQNEGLLNLAYKAPIVTYGPMLMIALFALKRFGSFKPMLIGAICAIATSVGLLVAISQKAVAMDQFWLYPITCIVFAIVAFAADKLLGGSNRAGVVVGKPNETP
jgi:SSS family transporter